MNMTSYASAATNEVTTTPAAAAATTSETANYASNNIISTTQQAVAATAAAGVNNEQQHQQHILSPKFNNNTTTTTTTTSAAISSSPPTATTRTRTTATTLPTLPLKLLADTSPLLTPNSPLDDYESLSDGREKADTTPENIKKIDDIIENSDLHHHHHNHQQQQQQQHHHHQYGNNLATSPRRLLLETTTNVGLAAAIDESNGKFCFAKPTTTTTAAAATSASTLCNEKDTLCKSVQQQQQPQQHIVESSLTPSQQPLPISARNNNNTSVDNNKIATKTNNYDDGDDDDSSASITTTNKQQFYAFTIDTFNNKESDPAATAAKYKNMLERFQSRHKRGASMSKLENAADDNNSTTATTMGKEATLKSSVSATPLTTTTAAQRSARNSDITTPTTSFEGNDMATAMPKVKLRVRDRSTSRVRDASKRHSWSPRSSTQESTNVVENPAPKMPAASARGNNQQPVSARTPRSKPAPLQMPKGAANLMANRTQFTPRSKAMQLALQKVDFMCPHPPLADDFQHLNIETGDNISETGTYTLDGDNYTEEQKDLMNIDVKNMRARQKRPKDLLILNSATMTSSESAATKIPVHVNHRNSSNVLEVNYYHDADEQPPQQKQSSSPHHKSGGMGMAGGDLILGNHQTAGAYLEQIKSRVLRNMSATKNTPISDVSSSSNNQKQSSTEDEDAGCFTSVTASGVLAKQSALDPRPRLTRRSSLSTSQIDSSEYISNEMKLKNAAAAAYAGGGFTDHQKSEYRLNVFTSNQKDSRKFAATRQMMIDPAQQQQQQSTKLQSDAAVLKTAQSKNDWIQEWARNARARSLANDCVQSRNVSNNHQHDQHELMTRSYTCASDTVAGRDSSLTDDSIYSKQCAAAKLNKTLAERYRLMGDCDYSSDPAISTSYTKIAAADAICKPPKSPSKIPSPLHSLGRTRSASRTRASLQKHDAGDDFLGIDDDDDDSAYLQKTAAAINSLQQSLSRKNSLRSPSHSASPRAHSARAHHILYSPPECSPQHSLDSSTTGGGGVGGNYQRSPRQQAYARQQHPPQLNQLMTSSVNEQQLQLLTSGEFLVRQMRQRKNSFDGNINNNSSPGRTPNRMHHQQTTTTTAVQSNAEQQSLSPLRRSSSFSAKIATKQRAARPQYQNIYTPPAARHNYGMTLSSNNAGGVNVDAAIKKSASSNNFRQVYSDYDENLQYYINDEDEMICDYYSSGAEEEEEEEENYPDDIYYHGETVAMAEESRNSAAVPPLSNTRYNKALLMRIERSKQKVSGKVASAPSSAVKTGAGVIACPNTPELPRRNVRSAPRAGGGSRGTTRQSMPRETSLSRLANAVPNSLASAKKQILQTAAAVSASSTASAAAAAAAVGARSSSNQRIQPKYMDISKYKPAKGNEFLRKNDAKSTLKTPVVDTMRRSPSSSSMGLTRADPTRTSNRSVRSVTSCMTSSMTTSTGSGRASSGVRRDASVTKQKEVEMAMWKRRSTYDPMKAAAEDRRKKDESKRLILTKNIGEVPCDSTTTLRNNQDASFSPRSSLELTEAWTTLDESEAGEEECF